MIESIRARPWPIHAFAAILLGIGLQALIGGLANIEGWLVQYETLAPDFPWDRDWVIVVLSARFTIVCIPVIAIWGFRSLAARILICLFTFFPMAGLVRNLSGDLTFDDAEPVVATLLMIVACALLFLPSAQRWFSPEALDNEAVFE